MNRRILAISSVVAAAATFAGTTAAQEPAYDVVDLGAGVPLAINEAGDVVGWEYLPDENRYQAVLWKATGEKVELPAPEGRPFTFALDINEDGTIVGYARTGYADPYGHAVRWTDGVVEDLGTVEGDSSQALGINDQGWIVGMSSVGGFLPGGFVYTPSQGMNELTVGADVWPHDVNESNVVAGYAGSVAFKWTEAGGEETLPAPDGYAFSFGFAINEAGQVAGTVKTQTGNSERIARWSDGVGWQILGGSGEHNRAWGINDAGDVVGELRHPIVHGFVYTDSEGMRELTPLIDTTGEYAAVLGGFDVNNAGLIAAQVTDDAGDVHAAVLVPVQDGGGSAADLLDATVSYGTHVSGGVMDLLASDDDHLRSRSRLGVSAFEPNLMELIVNAQTEVPSPSTLHLVIESRINNPGGTGKIRLRHRGTNSFVQVDAHPLSTQDATHETGGIDATNHVGPGGEIDLSVKHVVVATFSAIGFDSYFDLVEIEVE